MAAPAGVSEGIPHEPAKAGQAQAELAVAQAGGAEPGEAQPAEASAAEPGEAAPAEAVLTEPVPAEAEAGEPALVAEPERRDISPLAVAGLILGGVAPVRVAGG